MNPRELTGIEANCLNPHTVGKGKGVSEPTDEERAAGHETMARVWRAIGGGMCADILAHCHERAAANIREEALRRFREQSPQEKP